MKKQTLAITALALAIAGASAGSTFAKDAPKPQSAKDALAAREAAVREAAAKDAAAREAAAKQAKEEADAREHAARQAERERVLQRTLRYDPFTYRPGMSQAEIHKM